jgi:uncharacterized protein (UPF0261 family)
MLRVASTNSATRDMHGSRVTIEHSPDVTLLRTSVDENWTLGCALVERASASHSPATLLVPMRGFSEYDAEGMPFHNSACASAFLSGARSIRSSNVTTIELDTHINDETFADAAVAELLKFL